jgi:endonuclease/exonuclease/phosphatase family metal-dependent hydrolase
MVPLLARQNIMMPPAQQSNKGEILDRIASYLPAGLLALLVIAGCSALTTKTTLNTAPRAPDLTLQVASLNLSEFTKKFERNEISKFAKLLKKEQIDVLSVQGITRYPGLESRVDFVKELVAKTDMRYTFGEMFNSAGRQDGNAIFSSFPQRNNHNDAFDGVKSADFEAALQSSVDGGVKDVVVVSTVLPPKANEAQQSACMNIIAQKSVALPNQPMIVTGNLPLSESVREKGSYEDVAGSGKNAKEKDTHTRIWFTKDESLKLLGTRTVETEFGPMVVAQFGLFR